VPEGLRHFDVDMVQMCRLCAAPEAVFEASADPGKQTTFLRSVARRMSVPALLVIHQPNDMKLEHPITVTRWDADGFPTSRGVMTWADFHAELLALHEDHMPEGLCLT
jgi:hypothetical protein